MLEKSVRMALAGKQCLTSVFMCAQCLSSVSAFLKLLKGATNEARHRNLFSPLSASQIFTILWGRQTREEEEDSGED